MKNHNRGNVKSARQIAIETKELLSQKEEIKNTISKGECGLKRKHKLVRLFVCLS